MQYDFQPTDECPYALFLKSIGTTPKLLFLYLAPEEKI